MNGSKSNSKDYCPSTGSRSAMALAALATGPMSLSDLAMSIGCISASVHSSIKPLLDRGMVIKLEDMEKHRYFALKETDLGDRFFKYGEKPKEKVFAPGEFNPSDPFGLVAKRNNGLSPSTYPSRSVVAPEMASAFIPQKLPVPTTPSVKPSSPLTTARPAIKGNSAIPEQGFIAGLFSTGEMTITVGSKSLTLNGDHQRQLVDYLKSIQQVFA